MYKSVFQLMKRFDKIDKYNMCVCWVVSNFCDRMDCSPPSSCVRGILQARTLEWVAISHSRGSFLTPKSNSCLLRWWADSLLLRHLGSSYRYMSYAYSLQGNPADAEIKASYRKKQGGIRGAAAFKCPAQQWGGSVSDPTCNTSAVQDVLSLPDYLPTAWLPRLQAWFWNHLGDTVS